MKPRGDEVEGVTDGEAERTCKSSREGEREGLLKLKTEGGD